MKKTSYKFKKKNVIYILWHQGKEMLQLKLVLVQMIPRLLLIDFFDRLKEIEFDKDCGIFSYSINNAIYHVTNHSPSAYIVLKTAQ